MPAASLLTLIDDITAMLDDVAVLTKVAASKTGAVMGDDLALNADQVAGVRVERELPVVWAVAKGSFVNKLILVPTALLISAFIPAAILPLMMIGGLYLCFEGFEKVMHKLLHADEHAKPHAAIVAVANRSTSDHLAMEKTQIRGAIRTDFILSAEIIVIAIGTMADAPIMQQIVAVTLIALGSTVLVYGLVAGIVKLDDLGLALRRAERGLRRTIGNGILNATPVLMKGLSILGTVAMFTVGGSILLHGLPPLEHVVIQLLERMAAEGSGMRSALAFVADAIVGVVAGGIAVLVYTLVKRVLPRRALKTTDQKAAN